MSQRKAADPPLTTRKSVKEDVEGSKEVHTSQIDVSAPRVSLTNPYLLVLPSLHHTKSIVINCYQLLSTAIKYYQNPLKMNFDTLPFPLLPSPSSSMILIPLLTSQVGMWKFVRQFDLQKKRCWFVCACTLL